MHLIAMFILLIGGFIYYHRALFPPKSPGFQKEYRYRKNRK